MNILNQIKSILLWEYAYVFEGYHIEEKTDNKGVLLKM